MFSKNLKYYRLKKNMSKKELASLVQVTPMAISYYENGVFRAVCENEISIQKGTELLNQSYTFAADQCFAAEG